ncbi:hypothetical protein [Streptomyces atroolivaceus]|uniref:hypothetical protein n=1 Tax=Streptomyces atroolivaceus TaxID=66869 RepID=UPI0036437FEF
MNISTHPWEPAASETDEQALPFSVCKATALLSADPAGARAVAEPGSITCHGGSLSTSFNPGVTFGRQTVQVSENDDLGA